MRLPPNSKKPAMKGGPWICIEDTSKMQGELVPPATPCSFLSDRASVRAFARQTEKERAEEGPVRPDKFLKSEGRALLCNLCRKHDLLKQMGANRKGRALDDGHGPLRTKGS